MQVVMPKLGLTMTEGTITRWLVAEGQAVAQGDILYEFESEKSTMEFESPASGIVGELLVAEGETVPCGTPVAILKSTKETVTILPAAEGRIAEVNATPAARRRAREMGLDLTAVQGRGPNGRIQVIDVEELAKRSARYSGGPVAPTVNATPVAKRMAADLDIDLAQVKGSGPGGRIGREDVTNAARAASPASAPKTPLSTAVSGELFEQKEPLSGVRRVISERMSASASAVPHVTLHTEVDATNLVLARRQLNDEIGDKTKISFNTLFVALVARALREYPHVNACLVDDEIATYRDVNVALAVDTERGLLVPVIRHADQLSVLEIQRRGDELIQRALDGKSLPDDLSGGTFTITNLGMFGIDAFTPIINQPQAAILGVGRIVNKPVGVEGKVVLRDRLTLSLSFDHRIIDGGPAARFLQRIGQLVERPFALLL